MKLRELFISSDYFNLVSLLETIVIWILLIWQVKVALKNILHIILPSSWKLLVLLKLMELILYHF